MEWVNRHDKPVETKNLVREYKEVFLVFTRKRLGNIHVY